MLRNALKKALICVVAAAALGVLSPSALYAAPTYVVEDVLVAEDQWAGENGLINPAPVWKPHETDASFFPQYWISSNERGAEEGEEGVENKGGISIFRYGINKVLAELNIENECLPVVQPDGSIGDCAPAGAEEHPRHPHGIDIDVARQLAYQVIEHSGLQWNADRTGFEPAESTDTESGLLLVYDIRNPRNPQILKGYVTGHGAEEAAVNEFYGKVYVGNHEPSTSIDNEGQQCFVSVIKPKASNPYRFIDLPVTDCVQGIQVDEDLKRVYGTTHVGEKMYVFNSRKDTVDYSVDIRGPFDAQVQGLTGGVPEGSVLHMHDLAADRVHHVAYQTIHTLAPREYPEGEDEEESEEITGRWVAEVNVNPWSKHFKQVRIIDLSNGQTADEVPSHEDNTDDVAFEARFVHAHFLEVDPERDALLVSGEHTGNLGIVDTRKRKLEQVLAISRPIPGCVRIPEVDEETGEVLPLGPVEPHVHGVNIQHVVGTAYVSDEGEDCLYESVTILRPKHRRGGRRH